MTTRFSSSYHLSSSNVSPAADHPRWISIAPVTALIYLYCRKFICVYIQVFQNWTMYSGFMSRDTLEKNKCWDSPWVLTGATFPACIHKSSLAYTAMSSIIHYLPEQLPLINNSHGEFLCGEFCVHVGWTQCMNWKLPNAVYLHGNSWFLSTNIGTIFLDFPLTENFYELFVSCSLLQLEVHKEDIVVNVHYNSIP